MLVRAFTFSQFHNKVPPTGSTYIRVNQLEKYWPEFGVYKFGEAPDVLIFQKVYIAPDYQFPANYKGIKILDICDPDWFNGKVNVVETMHHMDAVTCPTENMAKFLRQMTDKPVKVIKDRFDIIKTPKPKVHKDRAKTVMWFGYRHNAEVLKPAIDLIDKYNLNLLIVAEDDPLLYTQSNQDLKKRYKFKKYNEETFYQDIAEADFACLPLGFRPVDAFKSENKRVKSHLAGLPVSHDKETFELYLDPKARQDWFYRDYDNIKEEYDVRKSVEEYKELIDEIKSNQR